MGRDAGPSHHDAELILRLYELRREPRLREAREWFQTFQASSLDEAMVQCPPGSDPFRYVRMVSSYWNMAASFVTAGILDQTLFFQSNREMVDVWNRMKPFIADLRVAISDPIAFRNLEIVGEAFNEYLKNPGQ